MRKRWVAENEDGTYAVGEGDTEIATCKNREDAMLLKDVANGFIGRIGWITNESKYRLANGGNSKGFVPLHVKRSSAAKLPVFLVLEVK